MLRVLVADDSPTARRQLAAMIESDPRFTLAGIAEDGEQAVEMAVRLGPDVMTMDLGMPRLDGVAATERIMAARPCPIVVVSAANARDSSVGFRALSAGAVEIVAKPEGLDDRKARRTILDTLALMAEVKVVHRWRPREPIPARARASVVGVCASTGGPPALETILRRIGSVNAPVLIVQHIVNGFAASLATWLAGATEVPVELATDGAPLVAGRVYLAPDDRHLCVRENEIALVDAPPVRHHRPSGDLLFSSLAGRFGASAVGVILTGMGSDGANGLRELHARGGRVLAQDPASCVIGSMPHAAIEAGAVDEVLDVCGIARRISELA